MRRNKMLTVEQVQSQLAAHGLKGFVVIRVMVKADFRRFLESRIRLFEHKVPQPAILRSVYPAIARLKDHPSSELIYRWEAESEMGDIVGCSIRQQIIFLFHWVMKDGVWVASMIKV